jgi:hypothetical protein
MRVFVEMVMELMPLKPACQEGRRGPVVIEDPLVHLLLRGILPGIDAPRFEL